MPFILVIGILIVIAADRVLPLSLKQGFYALSLTIKSGILFILPAVVFSLLFKTAFGLGRGATRIIALVLACVFCSNLLTVFLSRFLGVWIYAQDLPLIRPDADTLILLPLWELKLPPLLGNGTAMLSGVILGMLANFLAPHEGKRVSAWLERFASGVLRGFSWLVPFFILGFVVKLQYEGAINIIIRDYTRIFGAIAAAQFTYLLLLYAIAHKGRPMFKALKHMLPAGISGFTTMSSLASLPLMISGAQRTARNPELVRAVLPAVVNNHLVGTSIAVPAFAYATMKSQGLLPPSLLAYASFALAFVFAEFCVAAVPAGGILVLLPALHDYLSLTPDMLSLLTALYILLDPVITSCNVLGNGAFACIIDRLLPQAKTKQQTGS